MLKHNLPIKNDVIQKYLLKDIFTNVVIQKKQNKKKTKTTCIELLYICQCFSYIYIYVYVKYINILLCYIKVPEITVVNS